jgi:hypothetical protein
MTDRTLSPNTQAIYDAFNRIGMYNEPSFETDRKALAAALRAAADQCHSQEIREADYTTRRWICLDDLLAIAAELEGA